VDIVYGITMVIVFAVNAICYGAIYVKMQQTARQASSDNQNDKYHKAAKLMLLFVAVYLLQVRHTYPLRQCLMLVHFSGGRTRLRPCGHWSLRSRLEW
jgi:hypothetical protein